MDNYKLYAKPVFVGISQRTRCQEIRTFLLSGKHRVFVSYYNIVPGNW